MSVEIPDSFVEQFAEEVHQAYQRMSSKFRSKVRTRDNVKNKVTFQKVGKGALGTKTRHGLVPLINLTHDPVECTVSDKAGGDYVDKLDELRINHDERKVVASSFAAAAGRDTDDIILTAMDATTNVYNSGTAVDLGAGSGVGLGHNQAIRETFDNYDAPDDGWRFFAVPPKGWSQLQRLAEFADADYVGKDQLVYYEGQTMKRWNTFVYFSFSGLPVHGSADRKGFAWHKSSIGHAIGQNPLIVWSWENTRNAHFCNCTMQMGAVLIDAEGCMEVPVDITP